MERRAAPRPRHRHVHHLGRTAAALRGPHRQRRGRQHGLDLQPLDDQRVVALEAEPVPVRRREYFRHRRGIADRDVDPLVGARVAERRGRLDRGRLAQLAPRLRDEFGERRSPFAVERHAERPLPHRAAIGERDAPGGEHARERMDQHVGHPQRVGDQAGVLPARAAEAHQRVGRRIVAARDRHRLDRVRHARHRDRDQPLRRGERVGAGARRGRHLVQERVEPGLRGVAVERPVPAGAEHRGEVPGHDPPEQQVAVGHRQWSAAAVAGRARIGARGLGPDDEAAPVEAADRSASCRHRVDPEHRRRYADAADHRLLPPLERAAPQRHVGRGAAHVEADDARRARVRRGGGHADDPARGAREQRVLPADRARLGEAARGSHEQGRAAERPLQPVDVAAQDGRQVRVRRGGVAARDQADERRDAVADRHLGEPDPRRQLRERGLVRQVPPPVHQHDRDAAQPVVVRRAERGLGGGEVERAQHLALDVDPLVDLDDAVGQGRGLADRAREDVGSVLIADRERVAETAGDREQRRLAAPLEKRVGRDGGADPHVDRRQRPFGDAAQPPHRLDRRVIVAAGIDR